MLRQEKVKNLELESRVFGLRLLTGGLIVVASVSVLIIKLALLQVLGFEHYADLAAQNRVEISPVSPSRGLIYDRRGVLVAENLPGYNLEITREEVADIEQTLAGLSTILDITEDDIKQYKRLAGRVPSFQAVPLLAGIDSEVVAKFAVNRYQFPGVDVVASLQRHYPQKDLFAHVTGYVGRINETESRSIDKQNYRGTSHIGKLGIEKQYEKFLHGKSGVRQREVNSSGRPLRLIREALPFDGDSLILSIDSELQRVAYEALDDYTGSVVAIDNRSGEVIAMVSKPSFDPNLFVTGISQKNYQALRNDSERPLFNRALKGQYPPGSTIKPIAGLAGLHFGVTTPEKKILAGPYYQLAGHERKYRDWKKAGHGWVNLDKAITQSCDVYFYDLAVKTGIDRMNELFTQFSLGSKTGIDLPGESAGLMPSREWKHAKYNTAWYPGETVIVGIGQGYMLMTPLQLAEMTVCIANRGACKRPRLLRARTGESSESQGHKDDVKLIDVSDHLWPEIIKPMTHVMHASNGTGRRSGANATYTIAGKTGTAQVFGLGDEEEYDAEKLSRKLHDHALFVGFAPAEAPEISIAVVVEHGGGGSKTAAPIARKVMDSWFEIQNRTPATL